jgi:hypothetical protein
MNLVNAKVLSVHTGDVIAKEFEWEDQVRPLCLTLELQSGEQIIIYPTDNDSNNFGELNARDIKGNHYYLQVEDK